MKSHERLNVLFLAWNFPPACGGIEYVASHLAAGLIADGEQVRVIARGGAPCEGHILRPGSRGLVSYMFFSMWTGLRICLSKRPDIIVCPGIVDAPVGLVLSRLFRRPLLLLAHGSDIIHGGGIYRAVVRTLFRAAHGVAANSSNTLQLLLNEGCRPDRVRLIHPGVECDMFSKLSDEQRVALREKLGFSERRVMLSAGRVIRRKGIADFVSECLPRLVKEFPDLLYIIAGDDASESLVHREPLLSVIKQRVVDLKLDKHVLFEGKVSDSRLVDLYRCADLFILPVIEVPGDVEGFGIVFLEAGTAGVPAVSTLCGGIPEAVVQNETGLLVKPGDWKAIADAVATMLRDGSLRKRMGCSARERAVKSFDWPVIVSQYSSFMKSLTVSLNKQRVAR